MGERDYYLENDDKTKEIREAYKNHIVKMFRLAGYDEAVARKAMEAVMKIETRLATSAVLWWNCVIRMPTIIRKQWKR